MTTQTTTPWTKSDTAMLVTFLLIAMLIPFLTGLVLARTMIGSYNDGYCAALNATVVEGGSGGTDTCVDPEGRVTVISP
jgi:hypothetical protein